ncbi:MAG: AAA family ATPase [Bacteroidaceae bacterium]|nr:AAA family ATPase [Bacteroidaceae bacterium]
MQNNLFLQRLRIVTLQKQVAYDQRFHRGVNIIRGQNSSGKSTIIRFIFFALGGCYTDFVPEARRCHYVMAEVSINGMVITLQRFIELNAEGKVNGQVPMYIFFGPMDEGMNSLNFTQWKRFPYDTTSKTRSFSNVLFELMGLPEVKAESNITMHQILRLIYLDQESPVNSLFLQEPFDKEITRETVANLLLGVYNQNYSQSKIDLIATQRKIDELKQSIRITGDFLRDKRTKSSQFIRDEIAQLDHEIEICSEQVKAFRELDTNSQLESLSPKQKLEYQRMKDDIASRRRECGKLETIIFQFEEEIKDSRFFITSLKKNIEDIKHSIAAREFFDTQHLELCPECLTRLDNHVEDGHCPLCKSPIDNSRGRSQAVRIQLELEHQISESEQLLKSNVEKLDEKKAQLRRMRRQLTAAQRHYDDAINFVRSSYEERIDELLRRKGYNEGLMSQFQTLLEYAERYERYQYQLGEQQTREKKIRAYIEAADEKIRADREIIDEHVSRNGVFLLHSDQERQAEFMKAQKFVIAYNQNIAYITDRYSKLSASSSFYLKMVARFALFFTSLEVDSMKYPRLLLSDNMEDKGLEVERGINFQKTVVSRLQDVNEQTYQVIFATSFIDDELNKPEYTVGDYYTQRNKSLKNV